MSIPSGRHHDFVAGLPKAEIHVHHVGSASPRIVSKLAERHPGTVPSDLDELREFFTFRDFAHFVEVYLAVVALIRTPEDIRYLTYEIAREMATEQNLRYAEPTWWTWSSAFGRPAMKAERSVTTPQCASVSSPEPSRRRR